MIVRDRRNELCKSELFSFFIEGSSSYNSSAWPSNAEGKLCAFSISSASLH